LKALISNADSAENVLQGDISCTAIVEDNEALIMVAIDILISCDFVLLYSYYIFTHIETSDPLE